MEIGKLYKLIGNEFEGNDNMDLEQLLIESCKQMSIDIDKNKCKQFMDYKDILLEWNQKMNLTTITDEREIILKHFVDSISLAKGIQISDGIHIIDVGTGAGFPGIPIKIVYPKSKVTLLDSLNKRILFLNEVINQLKLDGVECVHSRAEDGGQNKIYREKFDLCLSRAVANLAVLSEYCLPFVKVGGYFISLKGPDVLEELENSKKAIKVLGGEIIEIKKVQIPNSDITHSIIMIKKLIQTSSQYPRKAGKASKDPIN